MIHFSLRGDRFTPRQRSRGFSLIEVLIAFVVLTFAVLSLTTAYPYAFGRISERSDELQAVAFGQQYMESVRQQLHSGATTVAPTSAPIDAGYTIPFGTTNYSSASPPPELASPGNFSASATLTTFCVGCKTFDVSVNVSWTYAGSARNIILQSVVTSEAP